MIDTGTLTDLITQFRNTTAANSISPETVGSILQKIVDILATAGTQANLDIINKWHEALKTAAPALTALSQGNADRNHVYLAARSVNLYTGAQADLTPIQIQQATTERAGAMRAQQVTDLNAARRDVADIKKQIQTINSLLGVGTADNLYKSSQISCQVVNGTLRLLGAQIVGGDGVDKRIDVLATAIRAKMTALELTELDLSYAPPYSSAKDPVNMAGFMIEDLESGKVRQFHWNEVEDLPCDGNATLLDVRTEGEYRRGHLIHDLLTENLDSRITIEQLSRQFLMNPSTMKELFKEVYGSSIAAHIRRHRMERASALLLESDDSVAQVARTVGYVSQSKFTSEFKKAFSMLPTEYRRLHKQA